VLQILLKDGPNCSTPGCLDSKFRDLRSCYADKSTDLCDQEEKNIADVQFKYSALFIECDDDTAAEIVLNLKASDFDKFQWISTENCFFGANWYLNIDVDVDDFVIQGDVFPAPNGKVTYNLCKARTAAGDECDGTVTIKNALNGNILAPNIAIVQDTGVILGRVVACNFQADGQAQINSPDSDLPFLIQTAITQLTHGGDIFHVEFDGGIVDGDDVEHNGQHLKVDGVHKKKDGSSEIQVTNSIKGDAQVGSILSTTANPPFSDRFIASRSNSKSKSSSSTLVISFSAFLMAFIALFF